ncbi:MAG: hypothetical protein Q4G50_03870 [Corynebacterium sp.]|uniref:hypothetical protein n=1 Tax=Corynebacterium sp. TaxID=1720 RepID=UPI0026E0D8F1|nr:hypothetical protein [Corynebacterium sp.]MDO5669120.1 hypothetical protein [Corynebacterium sp.]
MTLAILVPAALIGIGATWWASAQYLKAWGIRGGEYSPAVEEPEDDLWEQR